MKWPIKYVVEWLGTKASNTAGWGSSGWALWLGLFPGRGRRETLRAGGRWEHPVEGLLDCLGGVERPAQARSVGERVTCILVTPVLAAAFPCL